MTAEMFEDVEMSSNDEEDEGSENNMAENGHEIENDDSDSGIDENKSESKKKKKKSKRTKTKGKDKKKLTKKEIEELEEKQFSIHANLYKVQIKELLSEISITKELRQEVDDWFLNFEKILKKLKPSKSFEISEFEQFLKPIPLPLPQAIHPKNDAKGECKWEAPTSVNIVGSWANGTAVDKISDVDIILIMPNTYLNKSDFLNHKYHVKRAIYLGYLAKLLSKKFNKLTFGLINGNPLKPVLEIHEQNFTARLHAVPPKEFFKCQRFTKDKNNLRFQHFFGKPHAEDEPDQATPNYNFTLLSDLMAQDSHIKDAIASSSNFKDGIKLLKVWLEQRSLRKGFGSYSGFVISAFVAYLSSLGKINNAMNSYEVLRIILVNLAKTDLQVKGITFCSESKVEDWHLQFDVVFVDLTGQLNYMSEMCKWTFKRVQLEAERALKTLDDGKLAGFHALFTTSVPFLHNFDHLLQLQDSFHLKHVLQEKKENDQLFLNHSGFFYPIGVSVIGQLLERCLGKRAKLIDCELGSELKWNVTSLPPDAAKAPLRFGIIIDREAANKAVEKCESEDPIQAQLFKEFWGEKSQLRRFKDGTMCETVLFEEKFRVCFEMLNYILSTHLGIKLNPNGTDYLDFQVEHVLEKGYQMIKKMEKPKKPVFIKGKRKKPSANDYQELIPILLDDIANKATTAFDEFSKILRSLTGLPLEITTVQCSSSIMRFTDVHPTPPQKFFSSNLLTEVKPNGSCLKFKKMEIDQLPPKVPKVVEPISVVLHLETSGKWPDNMKAIDRLKCAFLIRIGQLLKDQFGLSVQPHARFLDVCKDGFVFRLKLTYFRELTLLKQQLGADGLLRFRDNPESQRLEKESLLLPQLTSTLHSFHRQYAAFGTTCRLAKRWLASHLLLASPLQYNKNPDQPDCRFTEESVELLVAHLFMDYAPHLSQPNEAQLGFLRFLFILSKTDWMSTAIILNFHDKLTPDEMSAIELDFVKRRNQLPPIFISSPEDKTASVWTRNLASVFLNRVKVIASRALLSLEKVFGKENKKSGVLDEELRTIFRPDVSRYDVIIRIKKEMNPRLSEQIDSSNVLKFLEYVKSPNELMPIVDFDPVQIYLQELRDAYGHLALFLHDNYGGSYIAVVWKPEVYQEQDFSISHINSRITTTDDDDKICSSIDGILEYFEIIGKGLVEKIETKWKDDKKLIA